MLAEASAFYGLAKKIHPIGLNDCFAMGYGTHKIVRKNNQLDAEDIYKKIMEII